MASEMTSWDASLRVARLSDVGMRRAQNQDAFNIALAPDAETWARRGHLLLVADGMGAHAAGELASKIAADGLPHHYQKYCELSPPEALQRALVEANAEIHRRGKANHDFHNMGTTASVLVLLPQGAIVGHVGDSRVYRLRGKLIEQLTFDHSLVWEMRAHGQISKDSAIEQSIPRNVITRSLGPNSHVEADVEGPLPLELGDTFLICSDGLTGQLSDEELGMILANSEPAEATDLLVNLANLRGGPDNITVVVAKVVGEGVITAQQTHAAPLQLGKRSLSGPSIHPAIWAIFGVGLIIGAVTALAGLWLPGGIAALAGLGVLAGGWLRNYLRSQAEGVSLTGNRRLGKGPYARAKVPADQDLKRAVEGSLREATERINGSAAAVHALISQQLAALPEVVGDRHVIAYYRDAVRAILKLLRSLS